MLGESDKAWVRPDLQHYLNLTFLSSGPRLQCMLLLFVFSVETPPPQDLSIPCGRCRTLESAYDKVATHITASQMGTDGKLSPFLFWSS